MRLRSLAPTRYGRFSGDCRIDFGDVAASGHDLHVIYGPNEAGKSTLFTALQDLFFGIETRSAYTFLHDASVMQIDAEIDAGGRTHRLMRLKKTHDSLRDASGQPVPESVFGLALAGLERADYRNMFSLDDDTLKDGGESILHSKGELGRLLFAAASGLAGIGEQLQTLQAEAEALFAPQKRKTRLHELKQQLQDLRAQQKQLDLHASAFERLLDAQQAAQMAEVKSRQALASARQRHGALRRILDVLPDWQRLQGILASLPPASDALSVPDSWPQEAADLGRQDIIARTQREALAADIAILIDAQAGIQVDAAILARATAIAGLEDLEAAYRAAGQTAPLLHRRQTLAGQLARHLQQLGQPNAPDPAALVLPAAQRAALQHLIRTADAVQSTLRTAQEEYTAADAELTAQADALAALEAVADPAALSARLDSWRQAVAENRQALKVVRDQCAADEILLAEHQARRDAITTRAGQIEDVHAATLRTAREASWQAHQQQLDAADLRREALLASASAFRTALEDDDTVQAARLAQRDDLLTLRHLQEEIAIVQARLTRQRAAETRLSATANTLRQEIQQALAAHGVMAEAATDPEGLLRQLAARITDLQDSRARHSAHTEQLARYQTVLTARQRALATATTAAAAWHEDWQAQLQRCWLGTAATTPSAALPTVLEVEALLTALDALTETLNALDAVDSQLADQAATQAAFCDALAPLCLETAVPFAAEQPFAAAAQLRDRLRIASEQQRLLDDKTQQLAQKQAQQAEADRTLAALTRRIADMEAHLGVTGIIAIQHRLTEITRQQEQRREADRLATAITAALVCPTLDDAAHMLRQEVGSATAIDALRAEADTLETEIARLETEAAESHAALRIAENAVAAAGGDDAAARLLEQQRTVLLELQAGAEQYLALRFGIMAAEQALRRYRETHQSAMLQQASQAFASITCGAYRSLSTLPEKQRETLIALPTAGGSKSVTHMSKGTAMQLYLALRIAGYHEFIAQREALPFVADDILETFDDARSAATFRLLHQLSAKGQVIYLTHHEHLCALAHAVCGGDVRIHRIGETGQAVSVAQMEMDALVR